MILALEITSVVMGIIQSILVMLNKRANWIFYCIQMMAMVLFSYFSKLYGDVFISSFYFFLGIIAYYKWGQGNTKDIKVSSLREIEFYTATTILLSIIVHYALLDTLDPLPLLDTCTTTTGLLATLLMALRRIDCWIVWFINDLLYIIEYYMLQEQAIYLLILNCFWSIMAIWSYIKWNGQMTIELTKVYVSPNKNSTNKNHRNACTFFSRK